MMNYREIIKKTCMALAVGIITFSSVSSEYSDANEHSFGNSEHPFPEKQCMSFRK